MKRKLLAGLLCGMMLLQAGCGSSIKQEDYDAVKTASETLQSEKEQLTSEKAVLESEKAVLAQEKVQLEQNLAEKSSEVDAINEEYQAYQKKMKPYEKLSVAEAEAKTAEAEQKKAEAERAKKEQEESEAAAAAAAESEAAAAAAEEEAKGYETGITYDQLARTPDDYKGKKVKFSGKVLQVVEGDEEIQIRLAVNQDYDTILYCGYDPSIVSSRVLEDDVITIYGTSLGLYSYTSTMGGKITIPSIYIDRIDQ